MNTNSRPVLLQYFYAASSPKHEFYFSKSCYIILNSGHVDNTSYNIPTTHLFQERHKHGFI